jgi:hypothetical protein
VKIVRLRGLDDADETLRGEIAYCIGARLGRRHCSLCEVTHGLFAVKGEWKRCRDGLPVAVSVCFVPTGTYGSNPLARLDDECRHAR